MKDLTKIIETSVDKADQLIETGQDRQQTLSDRHKADMNSDNWLSKSIRPLSLLILLGLEIVLVILSAFGKTVDVAITTQVGVLLTSAFGFYFSSRKAEKVAAQNAKANLQVEKLKTRHQLRRERKEARHERKMERRRERNQDKQD